MGISVTVERLALRLPRLARLALWSAALIQMRFRHQPHWLFKHLAKRLDYRVPVMARLGNEMKIQVPWIDVAGRTIHKDGWYEPDTVRILSTLLAPGMTFLDIGAAFGQYTLLAAGAVGNSGKVYAFEPDPVSFDWLDRNVRRNYLGNVTAVEIALGDTVGALDLYIGAPDNLGTTSLRQQYNYSGRAVRVDVMPLDRYFERVGLDRVDVIKMDVEGAESLVLRGAQKLLAMRPAMIIEFEESNQVRFGSSCAELARMLIEKGYKLESILEGERVPYEAAHSAAHYSFNVVATRA